MSTSAILGQLVLGYSPLVAADRSVVATRITVYPERRDAAPDAAALLEALLAVWPATPDASISLNLRALPAAGGAAASTPATPSLPTRATPLVLNVASEPWLRALLALQPPPHLMLELPAFMACDAAHAPALRALHEAGSVLAVKGRPLAELPRELLALLRHALVDAGDDRRGAVAAPAADARHIGTLQLGVHTLAELDAAFARGAVGAIGWPIDDERTSSGGRASGPDIGIVTELMRRVDREEPVDKLEAVLKNDPQLAFRLIRYLNSAAFGLSVEISSFRHALMMLGYRKLKRWLALLLASSSKDPQMKPAMFAAVRRGLLMEELVRHAGDDETRSEMFICGVFSLLDRMLGQPFAELFQSVSVPDRVQQALVHGRGPFHAYLTLVKAMEQGVRGDIREAADASFLGTAEVNAALLRALASARELD